MPCFGINPLFYKELNVKITTIPLLEIQPVINLLRKNNLKKLKVHLTVDTVNIGLLCLTVLKRGGRTAIKTANFDFFIQVSINVMNRFEWFDFSTF